MNLRALVVAVSLVLMPLSALAQIAITGVVRETTGEPIPGASVREKGTTTGSATDTDGKFSFKVKQANATIVVSFVGYETQEIKLAGRKNLKITLKTDDEVLDDVVVVGYGTMQKKLVTGATVEVKGENIQKMNATNPLQALQGQTPGVNIVSNSGQPGEDMTVQIRGLGTIGNAGPLFLIDGVAGDINTLNPADIERIDVLKDAASAAIYGSQAANGVVLVTTKLGRPNQKAQITFDSYVGWQNAARTIDLLNAKEYMTIMNEQQINSGNQPYDFSTMKSIYDKNGNLIDTDWMDQMLVSNAKKQGYNLGITGGSATSTYSMSLGYTSQEGIVGGKQASNFERYNFRVNSQHEVIKNLLKVGEQVSFIYRKKTGIGVGNQYNNGLRSAYGVSPLAPVYADNVTSEAFSDALVSQGYNGFYGSPYNATDGSDWYKYDGNPYGAMMTGRNENNNARFSGNLFAELTPIKGLKIRTVFGAEYFSSDGRSMGSFYHFSPYSYNDTRTSVSQNAYHNLNMTWTNTAQYDWKINDHSFNALVGMEATRSQGVGVNAGQASLKEGFDTWDKAYVNNGTASSTADGLAAGGSPADEYRMASYFTRLGWSLKDTYMLNATLRYDGSSRFARGHRYGMFPSVSGGWTISNEKFMDGTKSWMDFLKIRASWGQVGNQSISPYQYLAPIKTTNTHYLFGTNAYDDAASSSTLASNWGAFTSRVANPDVKWETSQQFNVGLDSKFFNYRLGVTLDYYIKTTKDWLVVAPILATVGAGAPFINGGDVKNTGVEWALVWNDNITRDFTYTIGFNGAYNKNEVGKIPSEDGIIHGSTNQLYDNSPEFYRTQNGHAIGYFWGFKTAGLFQNEQDITNWIKNGNGVLQSDVKPGDVKYIDVNKDGVINDADKVDLGNGIPDVTLGFNLGFGYKGFDFNVQANASLGMQIVQTYRNHANAQANYTTEILKRWTGENTSNTIPRVTTTNINWQFSDLYVHDADYLRISNVTLGYDLSRIWKSKYCSQCRVYVQAQNLFTFTKYNGMDPEIGTWGAADSWASGVDVGYYPRPRTFLVGLNVKF